MSDENTLQEALLHVEEDQGSTELSPAMAQKAEFCDTNVHEEIHVRSQIELAWVRALSEKEK